MKSFPWFSPWFNSKSTPTVASLLSWCKINEANVITSPLFSSLFWQITPKRCEIIKIYPPEKATQMITNQISLLNIQETVGEKSSVWRSPSSAIRHMSMLREYMLGYRRSSQEDIISPQKLAEILAGRAKYLALYRLAKSFSFTFCRGRLWLSSTWEANKLRVCKTYKLMQFAHPLPPKMGGLVTKLQSI